MRSYALVIIFSLYNCDVVVLIETWLATQSDVNPLLGNVGGHYLGVRSDGLLKKAGCCSY